MTTLPDALAATIARRRWTQQQAADHLGVSQPTVLRWLKGRTMPSGDVAARVRRLVGPYEAPVRKRVRSRGETVVKLLATLEAERGLSATEMIAATGLDRSRYHRLRSGTTAPNLEQIPALARALGVDEERLVLATYRSVVSRG